MNTRLSFTLKRKRWILSRDKRKCQATFPHKCDKKNPLQVHHILPHAYLHFLAPKVCADFPENTITLCRTAHEMIHPDVVWARNAYHLDNHVFAKLKDQRNYLMSLGKIYWVDNWDRPLSVIALKNTRKYESRHAFPEYKRRKHEDTEKDED